MLQLQQIRKGYGARPILEDVSADCRPGETLMVIGQNGSGKSTLLAIAAGLLEPEAGRVVLCGEAVRPGAVAGRRHLGFLPDAPTAFSDLGVGELLALSAALKQGQAPPPGLDAWIDRLGLTGTLGQRLSTMSFGQRKRAFLLAALIGQPWLLILDEPSNGLDGGGVALVVDLIRERRTSGLGTLVASNDTAFVAAVGVRPMRIANRRLVDHQPQETVFRGG
jgi:ABC-type multidrug transport system ATPase subunit